MSWSGMVDGMIEAGLDQLGAVEKAQKGEEQQAGSERSLSRILERGLGREGIRD